MVRWALTVTQYIGSGESSVRHTGVIDEVTGTREQAFAALWQHALSFRPVHPMGGGTRRWVLRDGDGFLVVIRGVSDDYSCTFRAYEVLWDSAGAQ